MQRHALDISPNPRSSLYVCEQVEGFWLEMAAEVETKLQPEHRQGTDWASGS